jgi:hypothetical protein
VYWKLDQTRNVVAFLDMIGPRRVEETVEEYRVRYLRAALDPRYQTIVGWDFGISASDPTVMLLAQILDEHIPIIRFVDEVEAYQQSYDYYGTIVRDLWLPALTAVSNPYALRHFGDPFGKHRDSSLESWASNLKSEFGIVMQTAGRGEVLEWCDYINDQYGHGNILISDYCSGLIDASQNYHYPLDDDGNPVPGKQLPVHDQWSHKCDAKRYIYRNRFTDKLTNRRGRGVPAKRILARGAGYDRQSETRRF